VALLSLDRASACTLPWLVAVAELFYTIRFAQCLKHLQKKNTDMHFVNGFLNGNCRDAAEKYPQRHTLRRNSDSQSL
jgi:hypothetical protein